MAHITRHTTGRVAIVAFIIASVLLLRVGGEGQATVLNVNEKLEGITLPKKSSFPSSSVTPLVMTPIATQEVAAVSGNSLARSSSPLKKVYTNKTFNHKKKLGLTLFFLGVLAENS